MYFLVEMALSEQTSRPFVHVEGGGPEIDVGTNAADVYKNELGKTGQSNQSSAGAKRASNENTADSASSAKRPKLK